MARSPDPSVDRPGGIRRRTTSITFYGQNISCPRQLRCSSLSTRGTLPSRPSNVYSRHVRFSPTRNGSAQDPGEEIEGVPEVLMARAGVADDQAGWAGDRSAVLGEWGDGDAGRARTGETSRSSMWSGRSRVMWRPASWPITRPYGASTAQVWLRRSAYRRRLRRIDLVEVAVAEHGQEGGLHRPAGPVAGLVAVGRERGRPARSDATSQPSRSAGLIGFDRVPRWTTRSRSSWASAGSGATSYRNSLS